MDLHLAASRNQLQALMESLNCNSPISSVSNLKGMSSVKSTGPAGLPCGEGMDQVKVHNSVHCKSPADFDLDPNTSSWKIKEGPEASKPNERLLDCGMDPDSIKPQAYHDGSSSSSCRKLHRMLTMAALVATLTFMAALHPPFQFKEASSSSLNLFLLFISFNTIGYFTSTATTIILLREYPFKPWPTLSMLALLGSYLCLVTAILPLSVILLVSSFAVFAAVWICRLCLRRPHATLSCSLSV